jgi:hypothetical protein
MFITCHDYAHGDDACCRCHWNALQQIAFQWRKFYPSPLIVITFAMRWRYICTFYKGMYEQAISVKGRAGSWFYEQDRVDI